MYEYHPTPAILTLLWPEVINCLLSAAFYASYFILMTVSMSGFHSPSPAFKFRLRERKQIVNF
jgi:hypothetical protein